MFSSQGSEALRQAEEAPQLAAQKREPIKLWKAMSTLCHTMLHEDCRVRDKVDAAVKQDMLFEARAFPSLGYLPEAGL